MHSVADSNYVSMVSTAPMVIVMIVGIILCAANWSRYPKACAMALAGVVLLLIRAAGSMVLMYAVSSTGSRGMHDLQTIMVAYSLLSGLVSAVAYGLLIAAVFEGRRTKAPAEQSSEAAV